MTKGERRELQIVLSRLDTVSRDIGPRSSTTSRTLSVAIAELRAVLDGKPSPEEV